MLLAPVFRTRSTRHSAGVKTGVSVEPCDGLTPASLSTWLQRRTAATSDPLCENHPAMIAAGAAADGKLTAGLKSLVGLAAVDPNRLTPIPGGSLFTSSFAFANEARLTSANLNMSAYVGNAVLRDMTCGLAGDQTFTARLEHYKRPIVVFEQEH